jgi:hypothetical protein
MLAKPGKNCDVGNNLFWITTGLESGEFHCAVVRGKKKRIANLVGKRSVGLCSWKDERANFN